MRASSSFAQKLHDDERPTFVFANFVDGTDVRVVQCGSGTGFTTETFERLRVLG